MCIGKRIAELRKARGLTQAQLANLLFVSDKAVSKWEQEKGTPEIDSLINLSDLFNVSLDYLIRGKDFVSKTSIIIDDGDSVSVGDGFLAKTHAEFLNELLSKSYELYMKCTYSFDKVNTLWMIRLDNSRTKTGWINYENDKGDIIEEYVGDPDERLKGHKLPPFHQKRYIFDVRDNFCDMQERIYDFKGVFIFDTESGTNDYRVWKKVSDSFSLEKLLPPGYVRRPIPGSKRVLT